MSKATTNRVIVPIVFTDAVLIERVDSYLFNAHFPTGNAFYVHLTEVLGSNYLFLHYFACVVCLWAHVCHCMHVCGSQRTNCGRELFHHVGSKIEFMSSGLVASAFTHGVISLTHVWDLSPCTWTRMLSDGCHSRIQSLTYTCLYREHGAGEGDLTMKEERCDYM